MNRLILLFQVCIKHPYFTFNFLQTFDWCLSESTKIRLHRYQLKVRLDSENDSLNFYYAGNQTEKIITSQLNDLLGEDPLVINIRGCEQLFASVTEVDNNIIQTKVFSNKGHENKDSKNVECNSDNDKELYCQNIAGGSSVDLCHILIFSQQLKQDLSQGIQKYYAVLPARQLARFYYIQNQGQIKQQKLNIRASKGLEFPCSEHLESINGAEYRVLNSGEISLPLKFKQDEFLSLVAQDNPDSVTGFVRESILIKHLPDPSPDNFSVKNINGKVQPCCDMFVQI